VNSIDQAWLEQAIREFALSAAWLNFQEAERCLARAFDLAGVTERSQDHHAP
jgi:hypothetical protein